MAGQVLMAGFALPVHFLTAVHLGDNGLMGRDRYPIRPVPSYGRSASHPGMPPSLPPLDLNGLGGKQQQQQQSRDNRHSNTDNLDFDPFKVVRDEFESLKIEKDHSMRHNQNMHEPNRQETIQL